MRSNMPPPPLLPPYYENIIISNINAKRVKDHILSDQEFHWWLDAGCFCLLSPFRSRFLLYFTVLPTESQKVPKKNHLWNRTSILRWDLLPKKMDRSESKTIQPREVEWMPEIQDNKQASRREGNMVDCISRTRAERVQKCSFYFIFFKWREESRQDPASFLSKRKKN